MYWDEGELETLRADIAPLLSGTAIIERFTSVSDGQGGRIQTWTPVGTVSCRIEPYVTGNVQEVGGELPMSVEGFAVIVPAGTDVSEVDRVQSANIHYEILGVRSPRTDEVTRRIECRMVK